MDEKPWQPRRRAGIPRRPEAGLTRSKAEALALEALAFLAADETRLQRFLATSGLAPEALRPGAEDPIFLGCVLDHLLNDEPLLANFCAATGAAPDLLLPARALLPGAAPP